MSQSGPALVRLATGVMFAAHGAQKLFGLWGGAGLAGTADFFAALGLTPAYPLALLVGVAELGGGLLLIVGAWTAWTALVLTIEMAVAVWRVHLPSGFFLNWTLQSGQGHGYEFHLIVVAALLSLVLTGPGALSIDTHRTRSAEAKAAGRARLSKV